MKEVCHRYPEWKSILENMSDTVGSQVVDGMPKGSGGHSDATAMLAIKRESVKEQCDIIELAARRTDQELSKYILAYVTNPDITFRYLKVVLHIPCGKSKFYDARNKFFWVLSGLMK